MVHKKPKNKTRKIKGGKNEYESRDIYIDFYPSLINTNTGKPIDTFQYTPIVRVVNFNDDAVDDIFAYENGIQTIKDVELKYLQNKDDTDTKNKLIPLRTKHIKIERKRNERPYSLEKDPRQEINEEIEELKKKIQEKTKEIQEYNASKPQLQSGGGEDEDKKFNRLIEERKDFQKRLREEHMKLIEIDNRDIYLAELDKKLKHVEKERNAKKVEIQKVINETAELERKINAELDAKFAKKNDTIRKELQQQSKGKRQFLENEQIKINGKLTELTQNIDAVTECLAAKPNTGSTSGGKTRRKKIRNSRTMKKRK